MIASSARDLDAVQRRVLDARSCRPARRSAVSVTSTSILAPISRSRSMYSIRAGLRLTSSSTIDDPGTIVAATTKNAADDGSPGTSSSNGIRRAGAHLAACGRRPVDRRAERAEHPLGVVAARRGLDDLGLAVGLQAGEDERGLHLTARDRRARGGRRAATAANGERRELAVVAPVERRAHRPQRIVDAAHRPLRQRLVAGEHREERAAGDEPAEHAHRRARVPAVEDRARARAARRRRAATTDAVRSSPRRTFTPELLEGASRCCRRRRRRRGRDVAATVGERGEQQRAVRDPLAAGQAQAPRSGRPLWTT